MAAVGLTTLDKRKHAPSPVGRNLHLAQIGRDHLGKWQELLSGISQLINGAMTPGAQKGLPLRSLED